MNPLREFIRKHNLSIDDLSLLSGVSQNRIYTVLNGSCAFPERILTIIEGTGEDVEEFLLDYEKFQSERRDELFAKISV